MDIGNNLIVLNILNKQDEICLLVQNSSSFIVRFRHMKSNVYILNYYVISIQNIRQFHDSVSVELVGPFNFYATMPFFHMKIYH